MANKRPNLEGMVTKMHEVEVLTGPGKSNLSATIPSSRSEPENSRLGWSKVGRQSRSAETRATFCGSKDLRR